MAGDPIPFQFRVDRCRTFTLMEALEFQEMFNKYYPTGMQLRWKSVYSGKEVIIGSNQ